MNRPPAAGPPTMVALLSVEELGDVGGAGLRVEPDRDESALARSVGSDAVVKPDAALLDEHAGEDARLQHDRERRGGRAIGQRARREAGRRNR